MSRRLDTSIEIEAAADRVWGALTDFARYPEWNPFVIELQGRPAMGERLKVVIRQGNGKTMTFRPRVVACEPGRVLAWKGSLGVGGLFDGVHGFELESASAGRTRLKHGETFSGLLVPLVWRRMEADTRCGFETMNAALKARLEGAPGQG
jgi:hypothetical protein